jgi:hypothetical protein
VSGVVDKRGVYHNRSDDSDYNRGNYGKLDPDKLKERAILHAKRLVFNKPTIQEIADHWNTKYGITMHYNSEKEWAWRNETEIENALNDMIESGEIKDPGVNETTFITTVNKSGKETARIIRDLEKNLTSVLKSLDTDGDYMALANVDQQEYEDAEPEMRKKLDARINRERRKNEFRLEVAVQFSKMLKDHKSVLIDTVLAAKDLYQDSKLKKINNDKQIEKKVSQLIGKNDTGDFDPDLEVTDEMRDKFLGVNKE